MVALGLRPGPPCLSALALATPDFNSYIAVEFYYASPRRFAYEACTGPWALPVTSTGAVLLQNLVACKLCLIRPGVSLGVRLGVPPVFPVFRVMPRVLLSPVEPFASHAKRCMILAVLA